MNTAISETVIAITVKLTSAVPCSAACRRGMPSSMWRAMFSSTTIESSTTKPVAMVSAISDRLSSAKPSRYMALKVEMIDTGTATAGIMVERSVRRNTSTTSTTSTTAISSVVWVSDTEARMVVDRSRPTCSCTSPGRAACSVGSSALMASVVWMMLAVACG